MQNYSLPCLLDLTAAPSYPPKSSNAQKRPATTNPKTNPLGSTIRNSSMRVQGSRQQSRAFMQTTGSFSKQPIDLQKDSQTFFCFTEFKTAPRPLKKLYTGPQHESLVKKRDSVKERYQKMYRNSTPADVGESMKENPEDLKGMVLEAEKVFSSTYSVKYFGLKDNQLGIVSKRVPIAYFDEKSYEIMPQKPLFIDKNRDTPGPENQKPRSRTPNMRNSEPGPWRNSVMSSKCEEEMRSSSRAVMVTHQHVKAKERVSVTDQIEEVAVSEKHEEEQAENYPEIENVSKVHSVLDNSTVKVSESVPYNQMENVTPYKTGGKHVVTQYMIPRKLQSAKKGDSGRRIKSTSGAQWEVQGHVPEKIQQSIVTITQEWENAAKNMEGERSRMWVKVVPEDQKASNTADFERKVMSLEKTKRSLLRNVNVEKAWETKGFQNELDVPARFRTHEVNKVLSDTSKYSYSQLLKTMYTKERPETALIENTQKLEKIISVREERRSHKSSKSFKEAGTPYKAPRENPGQYVIKVEYPKENKMLNQFIKIKTNVVNDQLENI